MGAKAPHFKQNKARGCSGKQPPPTPLKLFLKTPQDPDRSWKVEATFENILFVVKNGWLEPRVNNATDATQVLLDINPEYVVIIEYVLMFQDYFPVNMKKRSGQRLTFPFPFDNLQKSFRNEIRISA